jgi:ABC-2 type transport system permease protein
MKSILTKEVVSSIRDQRLAFLFIAMVLLVSTSLFMAYTQSAKTASEKTELTKHMREQWDSLNMDAHSASHYGKYVFTPQSSLGFFDLGISNYVGRFLKVEAHLQNDPQFSQANESSDTIRFGDLSAARLLQVLLPLLLIFMAYDTVGREREQGTLKLLVAQGVSMRRLIWQKIIAHFLLAQLVLIPVMTAAFIFQVSGDATSKTNDDFTRFVLLLLLYSGFSFIVICITVSVSAKLKESHNTLFAMLGVWFVFILFLPKMTANAADGFYPLPSKKEFHLAIEKEVKNGVDGHNKSDIRSKLFIDSVLTHYQVSNVNQLPINIDGALMQADEDYRNMVTKKNFGFVKEKIYEQNYLSQQLAWLNPFLSVRDLSMSICSTDYFQQAAFEEQVQNYRIELMRTLNDYMTTHSKPGDWGSKAESSFFQSVPDFIYHQPSLWWCLTNYWLSIVAFAIWLVASICFVDWVARNTKAI